jgi:TM2 domain-containing membrane protein YozV
MQIETPGLNPVLLKLMYDFTPEELYAINSLTQDFTDEQLTQFSMIYRNKRKDPQTILLLSLLGLVVIAGLHRFVMGQIGMGILYLFTGGLCLVGTIVDAVNYKKLTNEYNQKMLYETLNIMNLVKKV